MGIDFSKMKLFLFQPWTTSITGEIFEKRLEELKFKKEHGVSPIVAAVSGGRVPGWRAPFGRYDNTEEKESINFEIKQLEDKIKIINSLKGRTTIIRNGKDKYFSTPNFGGRNVDTLEGKGDNGFISSHKVNQYVRDEYIDMEKCEKYNKYQILDKKYKLFVDTGMDNFTEAANKMEKMDDKIQHS